MYDDLSRIERNYGCVAEYIRCQSEKEQVYAEPTDEELDVEARKQEVLEKKLRVLSGEPSEWAKQLKERLSTSAPKKESFDDSNKYVYACHDYSTFSTKTIIEEINKQYPINLSRDSETLLPLSFQVSIELHDCGRIYHYKTSNLNYEMFKDVFRDLHYLNERPTVYYKNNVPYEKFGDTYDGHTLILSNCSLGSLRYFDFKRWGIETEESLSKELAVLNDHFVHIPKRKTR